MRRILSVLPRVFFCIFTLALFSIAANAQFKANLQGTVTDPAGGVVQGATVTLTNNETQRTQTVTTNEEGFYRFSTLPPGTYTVTAEQTGFNRATVENFALAAEETQGLDLTLTTGQITESVTVSAGAGNDLQTENANVSGVITTAEVRNLPQVGRDPYELLRLTPGILGLGARSGSGQSVGFPNSPGDDPNVAGPGGSSTAIFQTENQVPISANGQRISSNNYQIDGVSVNSLRNGGAAVITPNQESVREVRVTSSTYSAELGRNSGAQVEVISQNGTNDFHGSVFFKYNNPPLNAFNKYGGINTPPQRVNNRFRQSGGSIGGPLYLPRFGEGGPTYFSGKDRLFFFFSNENLRNSSTTFATDFVETPEFRQLVINQRPGSQIARVFSSPGIQPRVVSVVPGGAERFGNDPTRVRVVPGGLDIGSLTGATGAYVDAFGPDALRTGGGFDGIPDIQQVLFALPSSQRGSQYNTRIDYSRNGAQFTVSTYLTRFNDSAADFGARGRPQADFFRRPRNTAITLAYIQPLSANTVNEARFSFTRLNDNQIAANADNDFSIPRIEIEQGDVLPLPTRISFGTGRSETQPAVFVENTYEFRDTLRTVFGNHAFSFGGQVRREQDNNNLSGGSRPVFSFVGLFNLANETPIFESINVDPVTGGAANAQRYFRTGDYAAFVQDDWKVSPRLTLNLGLRYEYFSPLTEKRGRLSNFIIDPSSPAGGRVVVVDKLFEPDRNNFAPRLGFAYSPNYGDRFGGLLREGRAVVRGGFGINYNRIANVIPQNTRGNPPFFARFNICCGTAPTDFSTPFAGGQILFGLGRDNSLTGFPVSPILRQGIDPATGSTRGGAVEIYGSFDDLPNSYVYTYSLEVQYEMPFNLVGSLGYQGSAGHKLIRLVDQTLIFPINTGVFDRVFFPQPDVNSNYNAMNARLTRRFANNFQFEANYRFSKSIDTQSFEGPGAGTNQTNPGDIRSERGPSDFDVRHFLTASGTYETNFFRNGNRLLRAVFDGFQINGILTANSGFPFTPKFFADLRQPSGRPFGPIRPSGYLGGALNDTSDEAFIRPGGNFPGGGARYFTLTPNAQPGIGRNSFRGPRFFSIDMSLAKKIAMPFLGLGEDTNLELRANFFNAFNQLNLQPIRFFDPGSIITDPNFGRSSRGLAGRVIELQARFRF